MAGERSLRDSLLDAGQATTDDPAMRFVLLREARDMAVAAGNPGVACEAIDRLAGTYGVDALEMKAASFAEASRVARGSSAQKTIAEAALRLVVDAISLDRSEEAVQLAETALAAARKSNNRALMQEAMSCVQEAKALQDDE